MNTTSSLATRFMEAPLILRAYTAYVLIAVVLSVSIFFARPFHETIVPLVGWSSLSLYMFTLFPAFTAIFSSHRKQIYSVAFLLGVFVLFGCFDTYRHLFGDAAGRDDFGNPYLTYHPLRPVITIALPCFWLFLMLSPYMKRWIKKG